MQLVLLLITLQTCVGDFRSRRLKGSRGIIITLKYGGSTYMKMTKTNK